MKDLRDLKDLMIHDVQAQRFFECTNESSWAPRLKPTFREDRICKATAAGGADLQSNRSEWRSFVKQLIREARMCKATDQGGGLVTSPGRDWYTLNNSTFEIIPSVASSGELH